ncbi:D-amino acid dehydrogenase [archaeon HR01]|nr:D-amino acid dehydrogenase [archaeon HR01]
MVEYDVAVIGGGILGLTSAYYTKLSNPGFSVAVIEKEAEVGQGNTSRSVGGYRYGIFTSHVNRILSETSINHFREAQESGEADLSMRDVGYLILLTKSRMERLSKYLEGFVREGKGEIIKAEELRRSLRIVTSHKGDEEAELMELEDIVAGLYAPRCGQLDVEKLVMMYKRRCISLGVEFLLGRRVESLQLSPEKPLGIPREPRAWQKLTVSHVVAGGEAIRARQFIVATGSWTPELLDPLGVDCFVKPKKRQVAVVKASGGLEELLNLGGEVFKEMPMTFFPHGLYIAPRKGEKSFWVGLTDEIGRPFLLDLEAETSYYYDNIHPVLSKYMPAFSNSRPENMWAGCYSMNNLDGNPIVFRFLNCVVVTGGSGSGVMKSDAVGRIAAAAVNGQKTAILHGGVPFDISVIGVEERRVDKEYLIL